MFTGKQNHEAELAWNPLVPGTLSRVLLSAHMGQRAGGNVAREKEAFCSQGLEHCSAEGARPQLSIVPLCSLFRHAARANWHRDLVPAG